MMTRFNNLRIRTKIVLVVVMALILNVIVAVVVYNGILASQEREDWVELTHRVKEKTNQLLYNLADMETGERGFVITGDQAFLESYNRGFDAYHDTMATLRDMVNHNPEQLAKLNEIDQSAEDWNTEVLEHIIQMRKDVNAGRTEMSEITDLIASGFGKSRFDNIRLLLDEFNQVEEDLLEERNLESQQAAAFLKTTLIGGTTAAFVLGLIAAFVIANSIARRVNQVAHAATGIANGHLDENYDMPEGHDEVGVMAQAFSNMAGTIRTQIKEQKEANEKLRAANATQVAKEYLEDVVRDYSTFASEVAQGNLAARLNVNGTDDDLSRLGHSLNRMVSSLQTITGQVKEASTNIASAAAEILAATTQQASSATEQSSAITQTTTTVDEVKNIAQQTAQKAEQVARESQTMLQLARQGKQRVEDTVDGMGQIRHRVEGIAQTILALSEQTQAIGAITETVSSLADQSNMLALNAAIEAARAGEQGKSFAVVAQQVRELAERSKTATGQVQEILGEIQRATNTAVMVTEEGTKGVEHGVKLSNEAGQVIHQIATEVESGAQANTQMAAASHQQTAGMDQIGQAMYSMKQATSQTLASTRQAETAARDLNELAQSLQKAIAIYRL
jgi:methyl-accepting chemotaxis protein